MDSKQQENKNIRLQLRIEHPAIQPEWKIFDNQSILRRRLEREPTEEELADPEYSIEQKIQKLRRKAEQLCQEILNEADGTVHVVVYLGGKGRVIGVPFIRFVRRRISQIYQEQGIDTCSADKLATNLLVDLVPYEQALNISGEFFKAQIFDLFPLYWLDEKEGLLKEFVTSHTNEPFRRLKTIAINLLSEIHKQAKHKDVHILLIDDQSSTGVTVRYAHALMQEVDRLSRKGDTAMPHQTLIQQEWVDLAPGWEHTMVDHFRDFFEQQLNFQQLFCLYTGDANILDQYSDEQLRRMMIKKKGAPRPYIANISLNAFNDFLYHIWGTVEGYVIRGGYAGVSNEGEILSIQRPEPDHKLYFEKDFGLGKIVVKVDTAKAVEAFNRELDALFAQGFA